MGWEKVGNLGPKVPGLIVAGSVSSALTPDAALGNYRDITVTGANVTVNEPTNGVNRQTLEFAFYASVATTITFASAIEKTSGLELPIPVPIGEILWASLKFSTLPNPDKWYLVAATVSK